MIDLLLVHGWGLSHDMWKNFTEKLLSIKNSGEKFRIYYLSPYDNAPDSLREFSKSYDKQGNKLVMLGHSLGGLKVLASDIVPMADAIVLVNSFAKFIRSKDFKNGINPRVLSMMMAKFSHDPQTVLCEFLTHTKILENLASTDYIKNLNYSHLLDGLDDLMYLDCRSVLEKSNIYTIGGGIDPLISQPMQADIHHDNLEKKEENIHKKNLTFIHDLSYKDAEHLIPHTHSQHLALDVRKIINSISNKVVANFNNKSVSYDNNAKIQELISNKLIHYLNAHENIHENCNGHSQNINNILELGCGTGLFTTHLAKNFPHADIFSTDLSFNMLKQNQLRLGKINNPKRTKHVRFGQINALTEMDQFMDNSLDMICSSMLFQWFENPIDVLRQWQPKLKDNGIFAISLLGNQSFDTINTYIKDHSLHAIFNDYPSLAYFKNSGINIYEDNCYVDYPSLKFLLKTMINTGANHNYSNNTNLNNELKILLREFNSTLTIKWNSIFLVGRLS